MTSLSSTRMRPRSGVSNPAISRRAVVLPLPEGPRRAMISPFSTASDKLPQNRLGAEALVEPVEDEEGHGQRAIS